MTEKEPVPGWRYEQLRQLGETERRLVTELLGVRNEIAGLVKELLPHHAPTSRINAVVQASGYSRTLVEGIRGGRDMWNKSS